MACATNVDALAIIKAIRKTDRAMLLSRSRWTNQENQSFMNTGMTWQDALFNPCSVAFVGLSNDASKLTGAPLDYLCRAGFRGDIQIVNPRSTIVQGRRSVASLAALERPVDHVFLLVNTDDAIGSIADCAAAGAKVVTILAGGFADAGPQGALKQAALAQAAREAGLRVVGPNSLGIANLHSGMVLSASPIFKMNGFRPGRIALLSQSGGVMGSLLSRAHARGIGFSKIVSVGNEVDLGVGEIGEMLVNDADTDVFMLFLESIRNADALKRFAERAHRAGKPILAYKLGRSEMGQEMAVSHTGSIVGSDRAADVFLNQLGIARVDHFEALIEAPSLFAGRRPSRGRSPAVGVVTTTGGGAALVVDALGVRGVDVKAPQDATIQALGQAGIGFHGGRILDLTLAGTKTATFTRALNIMRQAPEFDLVLAVVGSSSQFHPEIGVRPLAECSGDGTPVVTFLGPDAPQGLAMLAEASIAAFRTPEACADAIHAFVRWKGLSASQAQPPIDEKTTEILKSFEGRNPDELGAAKLFSSLGVPMVPTYILPVSAHEGVADLPYPLAVKVLSADIAHKTEAGGVRLNIRSADQLQQTLQAMKAHIEKSRPEANIAGFLAQPMIGGLAEALVGFRRDPQVGAIITLAAGGVLAELYRDSAVRLAPVTHAEALDMIAQVRGLTLVSGYRNLPKGDLAVLADIVVAVSRLAAFPEVIEAEINPVLIKEEGQGAVAVDALLSLAKAPLPAAD